VGDGFRVTTDPLEDRELLPLEDGQRPQMRRELVPVAGFQHPAGRPVVNLRKEVIAALGPDGRVDDAAGRSRDADIGNAQIVVEQPGS
jgi:hypothetical protein